MRAFCNERTLSLLSPRVGSLPVIAEVVAAAAETVGAGAGAGAGVATGATRPRADAVDASRSPVAGNPFAP